MNDKRHVDPRRLTTSRALWAAALFAATAAAQAADAPTIIPSHDLHAVQLQNVQLHDGTVHAVVVNHSEQRVEDLTLRVTYRWLWQDEFHPGTDSPGFSTTLRLDEPLAPGEQRQIEYQAPQALPARNDGSFAPEVSVVSFTAYDGGSMPQASN